MANNDPGAKPIIVGLLFGTLALIGGPVGLVLGGIATASAYALGRTIRENRKNRNVSSGQGSDYRDFLNYIVSKNKLFQDETNSVPFLSLQELTTVSRPIKRNQKYNSYSLINSIADKPSFTSEELHLNESIMRNHQSNNLYSGINLVADFQREHKPKPIQRQTRRRAFIDEYGQIWE